MNENDLSLLAGAAARWDLLARALPAATRESLARHLRATRSEPGSEARARAVAAAAGLLRPLLVREEGRLGAPPAASGFTLDDLAVLVLDGHRMVGPVLSAVRERLLAEPALDEAVVAARGGDPRLPALIRLPGPGGLRRLPLFQFEPEAADRVGATPRPRVLAVAVHLDVVDDPWGAADWWLSPNAWLGGVRPAALLGRADEARVDEAARCLNDPEGE
ncbi:hypothetical protein [Streptomyces sp. NPDC005859]|uniref:hypothetical protein n=1 Tax=Streptomyces sp. NPDC005859 TaxID=3157170 RepID=UPI00340425FF